MKYISILTPFYSLCILMWCVGYVTAEPITQSITLNPGWNAVFLEVDPEDPDPAAVFSGVPDLISVWTWNSTSNAIEFIQNPFTLVPEQPEWLVYFPDNPVLTNLHKIRGGKGYLIQRGGTDDVKLQVEGEPAIPGIRWKPNSFNFVGFHLSGNHSAPGPMVSDFFAGSTAHDQQDFYMLDSATGQWVKNAISRPMATGEAFWIYCRGSSEFQGPLRVRPPRFDGLHYGTALDVQEVTLFNDGDNPVTISVASSASPAFLHYWHFDTATGVSNWKNLADVAAPLAVTLDPRESRRIQIGVKRRGKALDNTPYHLTPRSEDYTVNLVVTAGAQKVLIPVSASGVDYTGLWAGYATINKVNEIRKGTALKPTGSLFSFRLIVHVDATDNPHLLQQVIQMWDPETQSIVLLTNDSKIGDYSGVSLIDGKEVGRRISSAVFSFSEPVPVLHGTFAPGAALDFEPIEVPATDPVNPFFHHYHPKHSEGFTTVTRYIHLTLSDRDAGGNLLLETVNLDWGSTVVGGIYDEEITGLHRGQNPVKIQGTFVLHKISDVAVLTSPPVP